MPQITVEYSAALADAFDRRAFALALHPAAAELIGSALEDYKTRFHVLREELIGDGRAGTAMIHAEVAILPGRDEAAKHALGELALDALCRSVAAGSGLSVQVTVEVRDIEGYHKRVLP